MPLYNYRCNSCSYEFEERRKISERNWGNQPCPSCGANGESSVSLVPVSPKIVTGVGTIYSKTDSGFRDNLNRMKKFWKNSTIKT